MDQALIDTLVRATGVTQNELVLIHFWGEDDDIAIMHRFSRAVAALGASPLAVQQSRTGNFAMFSAAQQNPFSEKYYALFAGVSAVLDVFSYQPVVLDQALAAPQAALYRQHMAQLFGALMQAKRFTQIRLPSEQNARESGLPPAEFARRMLAAYAIDYPALRASAAARAAQLQGLPALSLHTPNDHTLRFSLAGRRWLIDAGDGDMPCGEVYIAPVEFATNGSIFFEKLYWEDVGQFTEVVLTVENGVISGSSLAAVNRHLATLDIPDKTVCELGFGLNPHITAPCGYTVLDEKAVDTFHIAIGANRMFGGSNDSAEHVDLVGGAFSIGEVKTGGA